MIENKNQPAFPVLELKQLGDKMLLDCAAAGVTKREWMAAHVNVSNEMENSCITFITELMGKQPPSGSMANHVYWTEAEAKLRVMKADALLAELSKPQP
jgi:hypothetical protein